MKGLRDKLDETNLGGSNSLTNKNNNSMGGLVSKLNQTYLDGSPKNVTLNVYGDYSQKYDSSKTYLGSSEGAVRGQGDLQKLYKSMKDDGMLDLPSTQYTTLIGSEVTQINTSTPYSSKNSYSDQFRAQGNEDLLNRTIDRYI
jgi:hypothetical protein